MFTLILSGTLSLLLGILVATGFWYRHSKILHQELADRDASHQQEVQAIRKQIAQLNQQGALLHEINKALNATLDQEEILAIILQALITSTGADSATIMLWNDEIKDLRIVAHFGIPDIEAEAETFSHKYRQTILWQVLQSRQYHIEPEEAVYRSFRPTITNCVFSLPLTCGRESIGLVNIHSMGEKYRLEEGHLEFLFILAGQAALALKNAHLYGQLKRQTEYLEKQAITDGLTGLFNHRYFQQRLSEEIERSHRHGHSLSLCLFDLDHFKCFNDTYGHQFGDQVLQQIAAITKENIRNTDVAARYGGEEIALILPDTPLQGAVAVAERIRQQVEQHVFENHDGQVQARVTISMGLVTYQSTWSKSWFIEGADRALYKAKGLGRNRVCVMEDGDRMICG